MLLRPASEDQWLAISMWDRWSDTTDGWNIRIDPKPTTDPAYEWTGLNGSSYGVIRSKQQQLLRRHDEILRLSLAEREASIYGSALHPGAAKSKIVSFITQNVDRAIEAAERWIAAERELQPNSRTYVVG
jgi:hypothetical protein